MTQPLLCQKDKFCLRPGISYLNGAYMTPMLKSSRDVLKAKLDNADIPFRLRNEEDFFGPMDALREKYAKIIGSDDPERIAITPSVSYGIANIARQIRPVRGSNIVLASEQFPSNYYSWKRLSLDYDCEIRLVGPPEGTKGRGKHWNEALLNAIDEHTALVSLAPLFHSDGTLFDLKGVREKSASKKALLVVDGTQAIGAIPFDLAEVKPDALVCASYKWLLGIPGTSMAWYGSFFDDGIPIEESWQVHKGYDDFANLAKYKPELLPKGLRYSSGESYSPLTIPVMLEGAKQLLEWGSGAVADYARALFEPFKNRFLKLGCLLEEDAFRAPHLFGVRFRDKVDINALKEESAKANIYASVRVDALRISLSVYNDKDDLERLLEVVKRVLGS